MQNLQLIITRDTRSLSSRLAVPKVLHVEVVLHLRLIYRLGHQTNAMSPSCQISGVVGTKVVKIKIYSAGMDFEFFCNCSLYHNLKINRKV